MSGPIYQDINSSDIAQLVSDSNRLYCNLGPLKGAIDDKAVYSIGRAWSAKSLASDRAWAEEATGWVNEKWYPAADVRGGVYDFKTDLHLMSVSVDRDGEIYIALTETKRGWPQVQLLPATRVGSRSLVDGQRLSEGPYTGLVMVQGVVLNDMGRPVAYHVLGETAARDEFVSARDAIQVFDPSWADQIHGLPAFTHALLDLRDLRTVQGYERIAAMLMSSVGLIETNEQGAPDADDPMALLNNVAGAAAGEPSILTQQQSGVTTRFFRAGAGATLQQLKSDRPGDAVQKFMDRLIRNACTGAGWPYELTWDPSALGGANVRLLIARAMRSVEDRQDLLRPVARRIVGYAVAKAIKLGELPPNPEWFAWDFTLPARITADFGRDAAADREDYAAGLTTLTDILAEEGKDLDQYIETRRVERDKLRAVGLLPDDIVKP